jgi:hypothetical protein
MAGDAMADLVDQSLTEEEMVAIAEQLVDAHLHLAGQAAGSQYHLHQSRQEK